MTSTASQQNQIPAQNPSAPAATPSYASAAGATKKPTSTPSVVGSNPPPVVVGSSAPGSGPQQHHGKQLSASPVNGRPVITPAVPTVSAVPAIAHGTATNGHDRKSSVTIIANGPNSYTAPNGGPVGGAKGNIQFGYKDSPAIAHSTPQQSTSAPIPIPGNARVPSPAHSPSPIPQPSASGGRPPSMAAPEGGPGMTFGSLGRDSERHMKHLSQGPHGMGPGSPHMRHGSTHSAHDNMGNHGGQGPTRGGYGPSAGRGRGGGYGNHPGSFGGPMGYPPGNQYGGGRGQGGHGRGGMGQYQGRGGMNPYPNSPQPRGSPAMGAAMPNPGTPTMNPSLPVHPPSQQFNSYMPPTGYQNVNDSSHFHDPMFRAGKKKGGRRDSVKMTTPQPQLQQQQRRRRQLDASLENHQSQGPLHTLNSKDLNGRHRRQGTHWETTTTDAGLRIPAGQHPLDLSDQQQGPPISEVTPYPHAPVNNLYTLAAPGEKLNLSPTSGNFDRLLTLKKQTYGYHSYNPNPQPMMGMGYPAYPQIPGMPGPPYMGQPGPSPTPSFQQPFQQGPYPPQPAAPPMSRNASQASERPNSSTGHPQPPAVAQGAPHPHGPPSNKPAVVSSGSQNFVLPTKKTQVLIKNAAGETVDFSNLKAPASPAPSIQQSKTPPVVASSPTPPPKSATPSQGHGRSDSAATSKTAEQLRNEFKEQVRKQAEAPAEAKEQADAPVASAPVAVPASALAPAPASPVAEEISAKDTEEAAVEVKTVEAEKKPESTAAVETEVTEASKSAAASVVVGKMPEPEQIPPTPVEDREETVTKVEETKKADEKKDEAPAESATAPEDEEDEMERIIREMEEAEALREKQEAEFAAKKKVQDAEKKRLAEEERIKNAAENDRKLREQEREMERLEEEKERKRAEAEGKAGKSVAEVPADKEVSKGAKDAASSVTERLVGLSISSTPTSSVAPAIKSGNSEKRAKPAALNLAPLNTKPVEAPQPSAALQSLKSARFLEVKNMKTDFYPAGINSPNPALNSAVSRKGKTFKYDANFLLQFQKVFTEQPSLEFGQQVKSLIGDSDGSRSASVRTPASGRQPSRTGGAPAAGGFQNPMGSFGQPSSSKLPPNTTSEQRFAMSNSMSNARPSGPMGSFPRPFPGGNQMIRTPSSSNMGGIPNSPRQGSRSTRGGSKRDNYNPKSEAQAAKTMPLTQGLDLKPITVSATGWKPISIGGRGGASAGAGGPGPSGQPGPSHMDPEMVQRKVKAALNKMTPEKFDKLADAILVIAGQSKDEQDGRTLRQVIQLTFEKATDEAHWASMYAKFCKRMLETMSPEIRDVSIVDKRGEVVSGGALFRKYLLNRCQEEFERGWKIDLPELKEEEKDKKTGEAVMLSDEYYIAAAAKRRGLGLVQFIGELYKLGMLTERIMHQCVQKLVDYRGVPDEAEIESLCKLLRTIGGNLDQNTEKTQGKAMMDAYYQRIHSIISMPELPSRLKFMLMDIVDLRRVGWVSKEGNKGPKTLEEVRAEAEAAAAAKAAENARSSQRGPGGRPPMGGRGNDRGLSSYGQPPQNQNQVGMDDLRRLKSSSRSMTQNTTFGPSSMFATRSNSGRARLGAASAFNRTGEDSGASSRTGTPPTRESASHSNAFSLLANMETENPASPPSTAASPALTKAVPDTSTSK